MGKMTKQELVKIIIDNFTDEKGDINISGLNFTGIKGDVYMDRMITPNWLIRRSAKVGGALMQSENDVSGHIYDHNNKAKGHIVCDEEKNEEIILYVSPILIPKPKKELKKIFIGSLNKEQKMLFEELEEGE